MATQASKPKQDGKAPYLGLAPVELIASGYEWECPNCGTENRVIAIPAHRQPVHCSECKKYFAVEFAHHAHE